jgi:D-hexose-6-phosphate mutarotase
MKIANSISQIGLPQRIINILLENDQARLQLDMAKLKQDQEKVMADLHLGQQSANVQIVKAMTEKFGKQVDLELKHRDMSHRHFKEAFETHHKLREHKHHDRN